MIQQLPLTPSVPHFEFSILLEGIRYVLEFRWNARAEMWLMTISDDVGNVLLAARRVVVSFPLISRFRDFRLPNGEFLAVDTSGQRLDPGLDDLGGRVQVYYFDSTDLPTEMVA